MKKYPLRIPYRRLYTRDQSIIVKELKNQTDYPTSLIKRVLRETNPLIYIAYPTMNIDAKTLERMRLEYAYTSTKNIK